MRIAAVVSVLVVGLAVVIGSVSAPAQSGPDDIAVVPTASATSASERPATEEGDLVPASARFATLDGIVAVPMASAELGAVKGQTIHFLDANGGLHLAGNPENSGIGTGNWYDNGSPDGRLVHPSYHGLCVAGPISIPPTPPSFLSQCP